MKNDTNTMKTCLFRRYLWLAAVILAACACNRPSPQIPTQRKGSSAPQPDSAHLALLELNQRLALAADEQLRLLVQTRDEPYALYDANTWMTVLDKGDEESGSPQENEEWLIAMRIYDTGGQLLTDCEKTYRIGKKELPEGAEKNISALHHHSRARLYVPWYAAYGLTGTDRIAPYENLIIEIELK